MFNDFLEMEMHKMPSHLPHEFFRLFVWDLLNVSLFIGCLPVKKCLRLWPKFEFRSHLLAIGSGVFAISARDSCPKDESSQNLLKIA